LNETLIFFQALTAIVVLTEAYFIGLVILATVWVATTAYTGMEVLVYETITGWTTFLIIVEFAYYIF
jgi:hypothetical protein